MDTLATDVVVIGAGVIGLAVARRFARAGADVVILEAESAIGAGISSRSSEVIHGGIYYPSGSLKAKLCVSGRKALYRYCQSRGIPHRGCGKLIVAGETEVDRLRALVTRGIDNGVLGLQLLDAGEVADLEPLLSCASAIFVPHSGIIDSHQLMLSLLGDAASCGAVLALQSPMIAGRLGPKGWVLDVGGRDPVHLAAPKVINAAGLGARAVAASLAGFPDIQLPDLYLAKGNYFSCRNPGGGRKPAFQHLVYPLPQPGGLGIHLTLDLDGQLRFGPDVEWVPAPDYQVSLNRITAFYQAVRRYWPGLPDGALQPAYAGIRPKLAGPGAPAADFLIQGPEQHGVPGLINLFGIESPGLTSCLAIAQRVFDRLKD